MKKLVYIFVIIFTALVLSYVGSYSQDYASLNLIDNLGNKKTVTYGDAVKLFIISIGMNSENFKADIKKLGDLGLKKGLDRGENEPARRGDVAILISQRLKLKDSLFYRMFNIKRYATRACTAAGIMPGDVSERDFLSGDELIEIMTVVSEKVKGSD